MKNRFSIIFFLLLIHIALMSQTRAYELREVNKHIKISLIDILGNWYADDTSSYMIHFKKINNTLVEIEGIKHGVGNYSFIIDGDSLFVNGTAANWPPYNCTLKLLNTKHLEIEFYYFFSTETTKVIYIR